MKEEKENQKTREEKINLKETKEKKASKKAVKAKEEAIESKKATDVAKKASPKKATKTKKTTSKAKAKDEKEKNLAELNEKDTTLVDSTNNVTEEIEKEKVQPIEDSKKTKENNAKLEESIAKLKGEKVKKESDTQVSKEDNELEDNAEIIIDEPKTDSENQKRKEKLEEQSELIENKKKRKNTIIMTSIIAALILIIVVVMIIIGNLNSTTTESHDFYQWYYGQRVEYKGELTFTRKEGLTEVKATDKKVTLDSTPMYYADEKGKVIFPENMAIVYPTNNGMMYRINHFANVIEDNGEIYLESNLATKTIRTRIEKAFLYDGQDLYFFLERTTITVNGTSYEVSPLSYVIVRYKQSVEIYNYEKDEYQIIDTSETQEAKVETDTYTINLSVDSLQTAEKEQLLIKGLGYLQEFGSTEEVKE